MDVHEKVPISYKGGSPIWPPLIEDLRSKINFFVSPARRPPRSAPSLFRHAGKLSPNCEGGTGGGSSSSSSSSSFSIFIHFRACIACLHHLAPPPPRRECVMHEWSDRIASCTAISCTSFAGLRPLLGTLYKRLLLHFREFFTPSPPSSIKSVQPLSL